MLILLAGSIRCLLQNKVSACVFTLIEVQYNMISVIKTKIILFPGICEKCEVSETAKTQLQSEVDRLKSELSSTRQTVVRLHDREEKMKER